MSVLLWVFAGCAVHDQIQYFAATDPETGATNYYKMTISGWGALGTDYHLQAGYFSSEAVDVLRGSMPDVPVLDMPIEQLELYDRTAQQFYASVLQEAKRINPIKDPSSLLVSARSRRNVAKERISRLTADLSLVQDRLSRAETGLADAAKDRAEAQQALADAEKRVDALAADLREAQEAAAVKADEVVSCQAEVNGSDATDPNAPESKETCEQKRAELVEAEKVLTRAQAAARDQEDVVRRARSRLVRAEADYRSATRERDALKYEADRLTAQIEHNDAVLAAAEEMLAKIEQAQADAPLGTLPEGIDVEPFKDDEALQMSRQIWLSSLSKADLASMGRTQNTNPYQFRKLVFWISANNIDLNHFATEIDGVIDNVTAIAGTFKSQADQRKAQQESKRKCCQGILNSISLESETQRGLLEALFELVLPGSSGVLQNATDGAEQ